MDFEKIRDFCKFSKKEIIMCKDRILKQFGMFGNGEKGDGVGDSEIGG